MTAVSEAASNMQTPTTSALDRARSLRTLIESEAERTNDIGRIAEPVIEAFKKTQLFWMNVPAELGGEEIPMKDRFEVYEEVAGYDGSTGWSFMTLSGFVGYSSVGLGDSAVQALYGDKSNRALAAGFAAPGGTAVPVEGGYRLTGKYRFGSGVLHATYVAAGALVEGQDNVPITAFVPAEEIIDRAGWDVYGLRGSGSIDYEVPGSFVPAEYTFSPVDYQPRRGGTAGRMDFVSTAVTYHTAVALGIAKHALREIVKIADSGKQRPPAAKVLDQQLFLHNFTFTEARLAAARALMLDNIENARNKIESGEGMSDFDRARMRQTANYAHTVARETVEFAYYWAGTGAIRNESALGRCLADIGVAIQHALVDHNNVVEVAPTVIAHYRDA